MKKLTQKQETIFLATLFGLASGIVYWQTLTGNYKWFLEEPSFFIGVFFVTVTLFLFTRYPNPKNRWLAGLSFLGGLALVLAPNLIQRGTSFTAIFVPATLISSFLAIGFFTVGVSEKKWAVLPEAYHSFLIKVFDTKMVAIAFGFAAYVITGMTAALLMVSGTELGPEIQLFIYPVIYTTGIALALGISYDFSKPVSKQKSFLGLIGVFSYLGVALLSAASIILAVYIATLVPTSFQAILETGETTPVFLGLLLFLSGLLFFGEEFILAHKKNKLVQKYLPLIKTTILLEGIILDIVALQAILSRIGQHGMTLPRMLALFGVIFMGIVFFAYLFNVGAHLIKKRDLSKFTELYKQINFTAICVFLVFMTSLLIIDFDLMFAKSHFHKIETAIEAGEDVELDSRFLKSTGDKTITFLKEEMTVASPEVQAEIDRVVN